MTVGATESLDESIEVLAAHRRRWAQRPVIAKVRDLERIVERTDARAERWVELATRAKGTAGSPLAGEEWISGPWALISGAQAYARTLHAIALERDPLAGRTIGRTAAGNLAIQAFPLTAFDRLLLNGYRADVWMQPQVEEATLAEQVAPFYRQEDPPGHVKVILGAGNIASIPPLDLLHALFVEGSVAIVKLNPVNDYLREVFEDVFADLVEGGFVRFAGGGADVGAALVDHPSVESVHITGSARTHDAIVFGAGDDAEARRARNEPLLTKPITSELGGIGPTIVVPGPWDRSDIAHQAAHLATMKMHNAGFNCIALQVVVMSEHWALGDQLIDEMSNVISRSQDRDPYYPGAAERLDALTRGQADGTSLGTGAAPPTILANLDPTDDQPLFRTEAFGGAFGTTKLDVADPAGFLDAAVELCNERLDGTLGANILVHPSTAEELGARLEHAIARLRYGTVGVNCWNGVGYLLADTPWGAYPGHTLADVQSGIGTVHNGLMLTDTEKTVVRGPFRTFPQSTRHGDLHLATKPPWFVTHRRADVVGERLTHFAAHPSWLSLPGLFPPALAG